MKTRAEIENGMAHCIGTEQYIKHNLWSYLVFTDGVNFVRLAADAFWLVDMIASYRRKDEFQVWELKVNLETKTSVLTCEDGNGNVLVEERIGRTDFPLPEIKFFVELGGYGSEDNWTECLVLMLPSER